MSGDVTYQALKRLTYLPERDASDNGSVIAGQDYNDVYFTGGTIANVTLQNVIGLGDVNGPASSVDNALARYDNTTGKIIQDSSVTLSDTGTVNFTLNASRITGDMTSATLANRLSFQTSTPNSNTTLQVMPSGTGVNAGLNAFSSSDLDNSSLVSLFVNSTIGEARLAVTRSGAGAFLPFALQTNGTERMRIAVAGNTYFQGISSAATGQNARINTGTSPVNELQIVTSSLRYKKDVEDLWQGEIDSILDMRPVWFRSRCASDPTNHGYWGFIAEEVAQINPRLADWIPEPVWKRDEAGNIETDDRGIPIRTYNEDGSPIVVPDSYIPDGVNYVVLSVALVAHIKQMKTRFEEIEERIKQLEERL